MRQFRLAEESDVLRTEEGWRKTGHSAKTLVKHGGFTVVLIALAQGARIDTHRTEGVVSIQSISGRLQLHVADEVAELAAGNLLVLERGLAHDVEALEESTFLLSICRP